MYICTHKHVCMCVSILFFFFVYVKKTIFRKSKQPYFVCQKSPIVYFKRDLYVGLFSPFAKETNVLKKEQNLCKRNNFLAKRPYFCTWTLIW